MFYRAACTSLNCNCNVSLSQRENYNAQYTGPKTKILNGYIDKVNRTTVFASFEEPKRVVLTLQHGFLVPKSLPSSVDLSFPLYYSPFVLSLLQLFQSTESLAELLS
ncbi:hypothetical protein ACH5RR_004815 [Cinchona calisaya]|uniref:Uncharacterized protein n=1 Tax=Cinchona calisaya TaxID=153742 RepID=A0ABD3AYN7_9GENT